MTNKLNFSLQSEQKKMRTTSLGLLVVLCTDCPSLQLLDQDVSLHFDLLNLQLIRKIEDCGTGDPEPAIVFARERLAPIAPTKQEYLRKLERTMTLLFFVGTQLTSPLLELTQPGIRREVAKNVNEALLKGNGERAKATLHDLVGHRAWAYKQAQKDRKESLPDQLDIGLEAAKEGGNTGSGNGST